MPRQRSAHATYSGGRPITRSKRQRTPSTEVQSHTELIIRQPSTARSGAPPKKRPRQESATTGGNYGAQTGTSTASTRASVPSVRDENLHDPPSRPTYRTLRISLIPYSVTESQIRGWLQSLVSDTSDGDGKEKDNNVLELSLSPYTATTTWQVATATFRYTPWIFAGCGPGRSTEVRASFGDIEAEFIIDCDFLGITPLYASLEPTVDIVAVPGLGSHAFGSWKSPRGYRMWLRDYLPRDIQGLRTLIFGYDSVLQGSTSTSSIPHYARQLLDAVYTITDEGQNRPLIFIGHSLGGLVIKQALADARHGSERDRDILASCVSLCLFGVPNKGLNNENMMSLVKGQRNAHFINDLREGSSLLQLSYREFLQNVGPGHCRVISFFETQDSRSIEQSPSGKWEKTGTYIRLVTQDSATWAIPTEALYDQVPIDADHSAMVKFTDRADRNYLSTVQRLRECVRDGPGIVRQRLEAMPEPLKAEILEWISTIPYTSHHRRISEGRLKETGEWIFAKSEYLEWRATSESKLLLLRGIPGAGKTYVASKVIDTLLDELQDHNHSKTTRLVYFYCNRAEKTRSDPESILSALVQQLARSPLGILKPVVDLYMDRKEEGQRTSRLTMQETQTLLVELTDMYPQTIICIDALDEVNSESRIILLKSLKSVIDKSKNLVKIFAASRNDPDIVLQFSIFPRIDVQPDDNASDIHKFIISRMKTVIADQRLLFGRVSNELASEICDTLCTRSTGMFQLAALQIDFLCLTDTPTNVRGSLKQLPDTLASIYEEIYKSIISQKGSSPQLALNAFRWVKFSYEPLTSQTLLDAVAGFPEDVQISTDTILKVCQNFLILDTGLDTFRFAHLSVEEFLEAKLTDVDSHAYIAEFCLSLLCFPGLNFPDKYDQTISTTEGEYRNRHILLYSAVFWPWHFSHCEGICSIDSTMLNLNCLWYIFISDFNYRRWLLYHRSAIGMPLFNHSFTTRTEYFWRKLHDFAAQDSKNPLVAACVFGFSRNFSLLFQSMPDIGDTCLDELLFIACRFGYLKLVHYLFLENADASAEDWKGQTPLHFAAESGHEPIVLLLLNKGSDASATDWFAETPLHLASKYGHEAIVRLFLNKGVDASIGRYEHTPLQLASQNGHEAVVQLLLDKGADTSAYGMIGQTSLHLASEGGHVEVVQLLLDKGASIFAADKDGQTPLHLAMKHRNEELIRLLIEKSASASVANKDRQTPLHLASENGHEAVARMLIKHGASISAYGYGCQTPLHLASENGHEAVARLLIEHGASISAYGYRCKTPLHLASENGHEAVTRLLIEHGAFISATDDRGNTPLHLASLCGCEAVVRLLIHKDASISAKNSYRKTPS